MITTLLPILNAVSRRMKETTTDTSTLRIGYANDAARHILKLYKWGWTRKKHDLVVADGTQEYDLTSAISDYAPLRGIWEVYEGGDKLDPIDYNHKDSVGSSTIQYFYLKPDDKTIGFTKDIDGTEDIDVWYYAAWTAVADTRTTLGIAIPEDFIDLFALYIKYLIHDGKRQRYDARNALLDFKENLRDLIAQQGSAKIKDLPRHIPKLYAYTGYKRTYKI